MLHSRFSLVFKPLIPVCPFCIFSLCSLTTALASGCPSTSPTSASPDSLGVLQWNAEGLRARSTELLHFFSSHPVDLICIQESNVNLSSSFRIPGFSALRSDRTHSQSGILSRDATRTLAAASSFSSSRAYLSLNFLPSLFLHLVPILIV